MEPESPPYQYIVLHQSCRNGVGLAAVHAAHAAGESCFAGAADPETRVVVLIAETSAQIRALEVCLAEAGIRHAVVFEPAPPYNGAAIALGTTPSRDRERLRPLFAAFKVFR